MIPTIDATPWRRAAALTLTALLITGCGSRLGKVNGKITVGGVPLSGGAIMFYPENGPGAVGTIQSDGTYSLKTGTAEGAVIGTHKVAVHATSVGPGTMEAPKSLDDELQGSPANSGKILVPGKVTWLFPEKYSTPDQSPLTAEVKAGQNSLDFDIPKP